MLGARWSYIELGWGGYWAWDPVENAALLPWLLATAFLHSIMIQEKRGMLKVWNMSLILATGCSAIVGTFLVRSGILSSIHAFVSDPTLNISFVVLIAVLLAGSVLLVVWRRPLLRSEARLDSLISRESVFLLQNMVLVALALVIFWITFFPLISEAVTGTQASVGPPAFEPFVVPLALIVVLLAGIGPILAWRRVTLAGLRRSFAFPLAGGLVALVALIATVGMAHPFAVAMFACATFVVAVVVQEFWRGARARHAMVGESPPVALVSLVRRNRRRYGGYIVHAGLAVLLVGVAASSSLKHSRYATLRPGQSAAIGGYTVKYVRPTVAATAQKISLGAVLRVSRGSQPVARLRTAYGLYPSQDTSLGPIGRFFNGSTESQIGLKSGFLRDIWTVVDPCAGGGSSSCLGPLQPQINRANAQMERALAAIAKLPAAEQQRLLASNSPLWAARNARIEKIVSSYATHPWPVTFLMIVSPLVMWLWIGGLIMVAGALISLRPLPALTRLRARAAAYASSARSGRGLPVREPA
jgi:cytochrome c-type biogenesis protein CcmF